MSFPLAKDGCPNHKAQAERSCPAGTYCASFHKCQREADEAAQIEWWAEFHASRRGLAEQIFGGSGRPYQVR